MWPMGMVWHVWTFYPFKSLKSFFIIYELLHIYGPFRGSLILWIFLLFYCSMIMVPCLQVKAGVWDCHTFNLKRNKRSLWMNQHVWSKYCKYCKNFQAEVISLFFCWDWQNSFRTGKNAKDIDFIVLRSISRRIWWEVWRGVGVSQIVDLISGLPK